MSSVQKHSRKRDAILSCLRQTDCHPTADWVYRQLKPQIPDLSLGTVYRNLAAFKRDGLIDSVGTVGGLERFDARTDPHCHFICRHCGCVQDLALPGPSAALTRRAQQALGAQIDGYRLNFYGYCHECKMKNYHKTEEQL